MPFLDAADRRLLSRGHLRGVDVTDLGLVLVVIEGGGLVVVLSHGCAAHALQLRLRALVRRALRLVVSVGGSRIDFVEVAPGTVGCNHEVRLMGQLPSRL